MTGDGVLEPKWLEPKKGTKVNIYMDMNTYLHGHMYTYENMKMKFVCENYIRNWGPVVADKVLH